LLPQSFALTSLGVSCANSADLAGGVGRKLSQIPQPTGFSASKLAVEAGPVWSLEAEVAKLAAMGFSGTGFALGVDLYNSALPKPPPLSSVFKSENTSIATSAVAVSSDGTKLFALLAQDPFTLATSKDGGATFDAYHSAEVDAIADQDAWAPTLASSGDGRVLLAASNDWFNATGGIDLVDDVYVKGDAFLSRDGGATFAAVSLPGRPVKTDIIDVSMAEDGQTMVVLARVRNGVWRDVSEDNTTSEFEFEEQDAGVVVFWISTDTGATWTLRGFADFNEGLGLLVSDDAPRPLQISPDGSRIFALMNLVVNTTTEAGIVAPTLARSTLFKSDDAGLSWEETFRSSIVYDFATGGGNGNTLVILEDAGVQISSDGGATFRLAEELAEEDKDIYWNTVEVSRSGDFIALASEQSYFFAVSSDAGESFDQLPVDPR